MAKLYVTSRVHPGQKCRVHTWIDTAKLVEKFGIQAKVGDRFCHVIKDKTVWLFDSREDCEAAIRLALQPQGDIPGTAKEG